MNAELLRKFGYTAKKKTESGRTVTLCSVCKNVLINTALIKLSDWNLFRTNQIYSDSFRNLYPGQSELTRVNPSFFNPNQNSIQDFQSEWIRTKFLIRMNLRSEWFKLQSRSESFRTIPTSNFLFIHKYMFTFFNISDIATDPPFWKVCYRFSTNYYSILPHLGNILTSKTSSDTSQPIHGCDP